VQLVAHVKLHPAKDALGDAAGVHHVDLATHMHGLGDHHLAPHPRHGRVQHAAGLKPAWIGDEVEPLQLLPANRRHEIGLGDPDQGIAFDDLITPLALDVLLARRRDRCNRERTGGDDGGAAVQHVHVPFRNRQESIAALLTGFERPSSVASSSRASRPGYEPPQRANREAKSRASIPAGDP
jgi:hypothetical protein